VRAARVGTIRQYSGILAMVAAIALTFAPFTSALSDTESTPEEQLAELIPKVFLAYGGKDNLAQLEKNYIFIGEQKTTLPESSSTARFRQVRKGQQLRIDIEPGGDVAPTSTVYDGLSAWKSSAKVVDDLEEAAEKVLAEDIHHLPSVLTHFQEPGYSFKFLGRTTYRATPVYSIEVAKTGESPVTVFVDERNYLVTGITYTGLNPEDKKATSMSTDFLEYRPSGGTLLPFKQIQYVDDKPVIELTISSIDVTKEVEDTEFRRPDKPYEVRLTKPVVIPFEYSHKEILIKVKLNDGEPLDFLFDTGASQTIIDRRTAAEHFLDRGPNFNVQIMTGAIPTQMTQVKKIEMGDATQSDVQALILDLMPQTRQMGKRIAGIIGANVMNKYAVTIDFSKSQVILNDAATYKPSATASIVSFTQKQGPIVKALLNGTQEVSFLVDTGAAFNNLPAKVGRQFQGNSTPRTTEGTGVDGRPVKLATLVIPSVKIGTQTVRGVNFTYTIESNDPRSTAGKGYAQTSSSGVLGNPFWQNFIMTMDYKFQRLVLQPNTVVTAKHEIDQLLSTGDAKLAIYRDLRAAEAAYQKALLRAQGLGDAKQQARIWGRMGNLHRVMAKDLNRPEQARIAYEYFSKAQELAHKLQDRESEGRILADWSLLYIDNGQLPAARQALEGATLFAPQDSQVNVDFAVYLYKLAMYPEMQKYVEKALFLDPSNWQALWYKVKLAEMFRDNEQLKDTLKDIIKHYPWSKLARDKLTALTAPPVVDPTTMPPTN
jgi:predicted aspartyl protease